MRTLTGLAAAALTLAVAHGAQAGTHYFDDFESYGPTSILNFTGFDQLQVINGTVDYVHEPEYGLLTPYGDGLVDLDGSTGNSGQLITPYANTNFNTTLVSFEFDAAGNGRGGSEALNFGFQFGTISNIFQAYWEKDGVRTNLGDLNTASPFSVTIPSLASGAGWSHYKIGFKIQEGSTFRGLIQTNSNDNIGPLIDNVELTTIVPEPAAWALMILGFAGVGAALRRRQAALA